MPIKLENKDYCSHDGADVIYLEGQTKLEEDHAWLIRKRDPLR